MAQVKAVPDGYGTVTPFLNVNGAAEAIEFYKKAFGAEERARMPGPNNTIMHGEIKIGTSIVMISDAMTNPPTQASLHLYVDDADAWWKRAQTAAGAQVVMPIADMFWGNASASFPTSGATAGRSASAKRTSRGKRCRSARPRR